MCERIAKKKLPAASEATTTHWFLQFLSGFVTHIFFKVPIFSARNSQCSKENVFDRGLSNFVLETRIACDKSKEILSCYK